MIDTRWIDINKMDELNPEYRSRLVGREYNDAKDDILYTSTPPLEAVRLVVSWAATVKGSKKEHFHELMINDVRRAYFYANFLTRTSSSNFLMRTLGKLLDLLAA